MRLALPFVAVLVAACSATPVSSREPAMSNAVASGAAAMPVTDAGPVTAPDGAGSEVPTLDAAVADAALLPAPALRFVIVPMHLVPMPGASGANAGIDLELAADGTLRSHGGQVGQFVGDRVLGRDGRELIAIAHDGAVTLHGAATRIRFGADGSVTLPNGMRLTFTDDGRPSATTPDGRVAPGPLRVDGFRPDARATASLLGLIAATTSLASAAPAQ